MTTKNFLSFLSIVTASFILFSCSSTANVANSNSVRVSQAIDTGRWVFNVTSIQPQSGRSQIPNGFYTVSFAPGNLNVYLPYIGQAYGSADLLGGNNPLNFVSKNFEMKKALVKKNKWTIESFETEPNGHAINFISKAPLQRLIIIIIIIIFVFQISGCQTAP